MTEQEFNDFMAKNHKWLCNCIAKMTKDYHIAEDVAQETWVSAYGKHDVIVLQKAKNFIMTLARRRYTDNCRKVLGKKGTKIQSRTCYKECLTDGDVRAGDIDTRYYDDGASIKIALNKLPDVLRESVVGVVMNGFTYKEMANKLGIRIGTVLSRVYRGKQQLRVLLSQES